MIRRGTRRLVGLALLVVVAYGAVTFAQVAWAARSGGVPGPAGPAGGADGSAAAIVVLGAAQYGGRPSPALAGRLDHAAELYREGVAPTIVLTGGRRPGDRFTEASASAGYLIGEGVPESALLLESGGESSYESLAAAARILDQRGVAEVVLVSDPYHAFRVQAIAAEVGLDARVSATSAPSGLSQLAKESLAVAVGRLVGYRRLGRLDDLGTLAGWGPEAIGTSMGGW